MAATAPHPFTGAWGRGAVSTASAASPRYPQGGARRVARVQGAILRHQCSTGSDTLHARPLTLTATRRSTSMTRAWRTPVATHHDPTVPIPTDDPDRLGPRRRDTTPSAQTEPACRISVCDPTEEPARGYVRDSIPARRPPRNGVALRSYTAAMGHGRLRALRADLSAQRRAVLAHAPALARTAMTDNNAPRISGLAVRAATPE